MTMEPDIESKYAHNGKVMVGTAILLFILIILIIFFHTYVRFCRRRRRRRFSPSLPTASSATLLDDPCLDPSVLKSLPTFTFSAAAHRSLQDCAVCLSEFGDGDVGRLLPNCKHAFHAHCIDTWFGSHSTCPLCRTPVQPVAVGSSSDTEPVPEASEGCSSSSFPAPIGCPRKPLGINIIVEIPEMVERGSDPLTGDQGFRWSFKKFCNVN